MKSFRYVRLDPTGNLTCLVLDPVEKAEEPGITARLMAECEQVAYLEAARDPRARARIRLMGGEFCGNAAMASACYLAERDGIGAGEVLLEVSGAEGPVRCGVRKGEDAWEGSAEMPPVLGAEALRAEGHALTAVRMEGIRHFIAEGPLPNREGSEALLRRLAEHIPEEAAGLLRWNRERGEMRPLVLVKGSGTLVWETACGSGSAAVGALEALRRGDGETETAVRQPGGEIRARVRVRDGRPETVVISGRVRLSPEKILFVKQK